MLKEKFDSIDVKELKKINKPRLNIIDVRQPSEYESEHIPNSKNVPLKILLKTPERYIKEKTYLVCKTGSRSKKATKKLYKKFDVVNVKGGTSAYGKDYSLIRRIKQ